MKAVSVIIPHKNSSLLLERLLKSIPTTVVSQIIVVDDNSTEIELSNIKDLSNHYNFELYTSDGGLGAGAARNIGLKHAVGDWIFFSDADDFFLNSFEGIITQYINSDYDIIYFNVDSCDSNTYEPYLRDGLVKKLVNQAIVTGNYDYIRYKYMSPWGKMFKRSFLVDNNIRFEEIPAGNDMMFSVLSGTKAKTVYCDPQSIYMLTQVSGSISTAVTKDRFESRLLATLRSNKFLRENRNGKYQSSVLYYLFNSKEFGVLYMLHVFLLCVEYRANFFIGIKKIFTMKFSKQSRVFSKK